MIAPCTITPVQLSNDKLAWIIIVDLKGKTSYGHAIALWKKRCGIDQNMLIIQHLASARFWNRLNDK